MSARPIIKGKPGDRYMISPDYNGKWHKAVGIPLDKPRGQPKAIPRGSGHNQPTIVCSS